MLHHVNALTTKTLSEPQNHHQCRFFGYDSQNQDTIRAMQTSRDQMQHWLTLEATDYEIKVPCDDGDGREEEAIGF